MVFSHCAHGDAGIESPQWAVDPLRAGPDLPPSGRSLFDFLVTVEGDLGAEYSIPFPFSDLLTAIEARLEPHTYFTSPLQRVLVPLGRSLQRNAASPRFFEYPRAVVAVDAEPSRNAGSAGLLIKHRLYLGYHESAGVIEIISYNEAAGRFEFQLVQDYREGATPRLVYANRTLCMTCHQNAAPIFAKPLWDESNANRKISARLENIRRHYYGFPARQTVDVAYAFDNATDQANRYAAYQKVWREACNGDSVEAIRCRAALFTAALQYRLTSGREYDTASPQYANALMSRLVTHWNRAWPGGLAVPDPDIPNRKPLPDSGVVRTTPELSQAELLYVSDVPAGLEPLQFRAPKETWLISDANQGDMQQIVAGLAQFLSAADIETLDRHLGRTVGAESELQGECRVSVDRPWPRFSKMRLDCGEDAEKPEALEIKGSIYEEPRSGSSGKLTRVSSGNTTFNDLLVNGWRIHRAEDGTRLELEIAISHTGLNPRLANGNSIRSLKLDLDTAALEKGRNTRAIATARVAPDFAVVSRAIERVAEKTRDGKNDAFADAPFRRAVVMQSLHAELGMPPLDWCCVDAAGLPAPKLEEKVAAHREEQLDEAVQLFHRYCGLCHRSPSSAPPNFLWGDAERQLSQCAERIAFRLSMWQSPAEERPKTPMPPRLALPLLNVAEHDWMNHHDLVALTDHARGLLPESTTLDGLLDREYATLRSCLTSTQTQ